MNAAIGAPPPTVQATSSGSLQAAQLTCAIGAEIRNVGLCIPALMAEIRALLFRDQDISRAEHVAFARHLGELEVVPPRASLITLGTSRSRITRRDRGRT